MEQEIFKIRPSMKPIILLYVLVLALLVAIYIASLYSMILVGFVGLLALVALFETIVTHFKRTFTVYTLTSENIRFRTGIIGKRETTVPLIKIQNVTFVYSIIQRVFGMGNVIIETAGERVSGINLRNIDRPEAKAKQILETAKNFQRTGAQSINQI